MDTRGASSAEYADDATTGGIPPSCLFLQSGANNEASPQTTLPHRGPIHTGNQRANGDDAGERGYPGGTQTHVNTWATLSGPKQRSPGLVYEIPCTDCRITYISETKNFPERIRQHRNDEHSFNAARNALAEHRKKLYHRINFDAARVIETEGSYSKRQFLESRHIQSTPENIQRCLY